MVWSLNLTADNELFYTKAETESLDAARKIENHIFDIKTSKDTINSTNAKVSHLSENEQLSFEVGYDKITQINMITKEEKTIFYTEEGYINNILYTFIKIII